MASSIVSIAGCDAYDYETVYRQMKEAVDHLGGMDAFVTRDDRVLIKPNILVARSSERAVQTHPAVVEAAIRLVLEAGGKPQVGDSPAFGSLAGCAETGGLTPILKKYDVPLTRCEEAAVVKNPGGAFKTFEVAKAALEVDKIINLPKFKTHGQMVMTLAAKNTFGLVPGVRKTQWHFRIGNNPAHFARMLVDLHYRMAPVLSIIDGIIGMEGNGPGSGDPVDLGLIVAGTDASAIDTVCCRIVGLDPTLLFTLAEAKKEGRGTTDFADIEIRGKSLKDVTVTGFHFPATGPLITAMPAVLSRVARRVLTPRPVIVPELCIECGRCETICPARAISGPPPAARRRPPKAPGRMRIDYSACIRCFCCQEVCPEKAVTIRSGWFIRNKT